MLSIKFLGAAQTVTGSNYLVTSDNVKFLVDCGMFQGPDVFMRNYEAFDFNPQELDFVVVTHTHIDHIGLVPKLIAHGFHGPIFITTDSARLAYHLLLDAAKIQEGSLSRKPQAGMRVLQPLYSTTDAIQATEQFETYNYDESFTYKGVELRFERVGHVLGAASVECKVEGKTLFFSGDIGRLVHPFLEGFDTSPRQADYVIMEALYGGIFHESRDITIKNIVRDINQTLERNGNVIIPAFALQRTQELLNIIKFAYRNNLIKRKVSVYLDSPLAEKITREYTHSIFAKNFSGHELFEFDELRYIRNPRRVIGKQGEASIIIAGSGMADGGRIMGHLQRGLPDSRNTVFIVGFQAEQTLGRELTQKPSMVRINNKNIAVRAQINEYYGLSAHGDQSDLSSWLNRFGEDRLKQVFLVHAEKERFDAFLKNSKQSLNYTVPDWKEEITLN